MLSEEMCAIYTQGLMCKQGLRLGTACLLLVMHFYRQLHTCDYKTTTSSSSKVAGLSAMHTYRALPANIQCFQSSNYQSPFGLQEVHALLALAEAQPTQTAALEQAIQTGRNCRLLDRALLREADVKLRERKKAQPAEHRSHYALLRQPAPAYAPPPQFTPQYVPQQHAPSQAVSPATPRPRSADAQRDRLMPSYMPQQQPQLQTSQPTLPQQYAAQPSSSQQYASQHKVPQYAPQLAGSSSSGSQHGSPLHFMPQPAAATKQDSRKSSVYAPLFQEPDQNGLQTAEPAGVLCKAPQYLPQPDRAVGQGRAPQYAPQQAVASTSGPQEEPSSLQYMPLQQQKSAAQTANQAAAPQRKASQQYLPHFAPPPTAAPTNPRLPPQQTPAFLEQPAVQQAAQQPMPQWLAAATSSGQVPAQHQASNPAPAGRAQADAQQQGQSEPITGRLLHMVRQDKAALHHAAVVKATGGAGSTTPSTTMHVYSIKCYCQP